MNGRSDAVGAGALPVEPGSLGFAASLAATWRQTAVAASSGVLTAIPFLAPAFHPLAWIAFVPLLWVLRRAATTREAVIAAFAAGFVTNFLGFYWLIYTMNVFGGFPTPIAAFFYLCLTAYSAGQFILLALGIRRLGLAVFGLAPALLWVALEFLYLNLFPWRMANTQVHLPVLLQVADLGGPYVLSLAILWVNAGVVLGLDRPRRLGPLAAALAGVAAVGAYGGVRMPQIEAAMAAAPALRVGLVQGNISIEHKRNTAFINVNIDRYRALSESIQDQVDLLIWPETVAQWWTPAEATVIDPKHHPFPDLRTHLIYGGLAYRYTSEPEPETFNSAFLIGPGGHLLGRYDKHILMPFGEYLPGGSLLPFIKELSPNSGDFTPGRGVTTFTVNEALIGPLICYEDIVTGIPREATRAGAQVLFNILNDAWFGDSAGPHEHQLLALWRAVENRRYLLRASNTGVTSVIDPLGRVAGELGTFREDVLVRTIQPLSLISVYARIGDVFGWAVVLVVAALLWRARRRGPQE